MAAAGAFGVTRFTPSPCDPATWRPAPAPSATLPEPQTLALALVLVLAMLALGGARAARPSRLR